MFGSNNCYSLADIAAVSNNNRSGDGMWDNGSWWIIILFLFIFAGWNGNGGGVFGGAGSTGSGITDGYILTSDFANIERKIDGVNNGLCDGFYAMNTSLLNGFAGVNNAIQADTIANMQNANALQAQVKDCCCQNERLTMQSNYDAATRAANTDNLISNNFAALNYNLADQSCQTRRTVTDTTRDIIANQDANTRSILDFLTQDKISTLQAENQSLKFSASQQAQNAYLISQLQPCPVPAYVVPNPYAGTCNCCNC